MQELVNSVSATPILEVLKDEVGDVEAINPSEQVLVANDKAPPQELKDAVERLHREDHNVFER